MTTDENLSMTPDNDKAPQRRKRPRKGPIVGILLLLFLLAGIGAGAWWYLFLRFEESTDDAYVAGNVLRIMPQVGGKVVAVDVDDNDMVAAGQTLVRLDPVEPDRRRAIGWALEQGRPGDVIVLAGKGHETYQEIDGIQYPMDEREIVKEWFQKAETRQDKSGNIPLSVV